MTDLSTKEWRNLVQRLIKIEMSRQDVRYQELSERLAAIGVSQSADNLRNKVNKGILGADLLLQIMSVLKVKDIPLADVHAMFVEPWV